MTLKKSFLIPLLATCCLMPLSASAALDYPGTECATAMDLVAGCKITGAAFQDVETAVYAKLTAPGNTTPANETQAVNAMDKLLIAVNGYSMFNLLTAIVPGYETLSDPFTTMYPDDLGLDDLVDTGGVGFLSVVTNESNHGSSVQDNALALQTLLFFINSLRNDDIPMTVVGYSFGGVSARYALANMEASSIEHNTNLFVSVDSPHRGASVPHSLQNVLNIIQMYIDDLDAMVVGSAANGVYLDLKINGMDAVQTSYNYVEMIQGQTVSTKIGRQLLIEQVNDSGEHAPYLLAMQTVGYPQKTRNIAVTYGNLGAVQQTAEPLLANGEYFNLDARIGTATVQALLQMKMYPTTASTKNIDSNIGARWVESITGPCPFPLQMFKCTTNNNMAVNVPRAINTASSILDLDFVPGGYLGLGEYMRDVARNIDEDPSTTFYSFDYNHSEQKFTYIPAYSALDINSVNPAGVQLVSESPFDWVLEAADIAIGENNLSHTEKNIGVLSDEIQAALADEESRVLAMVNHATSSRAFFLRAVGISSGTDINNILGYRAGLDGILNTVDDNTFASIAQLQALPLGSTPVNLLKAQARIWSSTQSKQLVALLAFLNNSATTATLLASETGITNIQANNIINHRNGTDGIANTSDDKLFSNIYDIADITGIDAAALKKLLDYAQVTL